MDLFEMKCFSAALLWTLSICFGLILPYFLWKISLQKYYFDVPLSEDENEEERDYELPRNDSRNLISSGYRGGNGLCGRPSVLCKRSASSLRVKLSGGTFLSMVNCMCGGVFLGVSLLDLIPQSNNAVSAFMDAVRVSTTYPVAELAVSVGLLLVMIVETMMTELVVPTRSSERAKQRCSEAGGETAVRDIEDRIAAYRMYVLIATISLHSIFEGMAIGLEKEMPTLVQLLIAISVHKSVLTFTIGLRLFEVLGKLEKSCVAIFCSLIFCSASPIGCFAGAFVSNDRFNAAPDTLLAMAVLQCLASGTFLYVTFVEVIPREFAHDPKEHFPQRDSENFPNVGVEPNVNPSVIGVESVSEDASSERGEGRSHEHPKRQSKLLKLLMLIVGFAIASGLQFL